MHGEEGRLVREEGFQGTMQAETEWDVMSLGGGDVNSADFQKGLLVNGHIPTQTKAAAGGDGQLRYDLALLDGGRQESRSATTYISLRSSLALPVSTQTRTWPQRSQSEVAR